mgnify:CR=1 FL=1
MSHHVAGRARVEESRSTKVARRVESGGRHWAGELSKVHAISSGGIDAKAVRTHACGETVVVLRLRSKDGSVLERLSGCVGFVLNEERRHWVVSEH